MFPRLCWATSGSSEHGSRLSPASWPLSLRGFLGFNMVFGVELVLFEPNPCARASSAHRAAALMFW